jgi:hypothetical protein
MTQVQWKTMNPAQRCCHASFAIPISRCLRGHFCSLHLPLRESPEDRIRKMEGEGWGRNH